MKTIPTRFERTPDGRKQMLEDKNYLGKMTHCTWIELVPYDRTVTIHLSTVAARQEQKLLQLRRFFWSIRTFLATRRKRKHHMWKRGLFELEKHCPYIYSRLYNTAVIPQHECPWLVISRGENLGCCWRGLAGATPDPMGRSLENLM